MQEFIWRSLINWKRKKQTGFLFVKSQDHINELINVTTICCLKNRVSSQWNQYFLHNSYQHVSKRNVQMCWFGILSTTTKNIDYGIVPTVTVTISKLVILRNDQGWRKMMDCINRFAVKHNLQLTLTRRIRKRKRFMDELSIAETIRDPMEKLRTTVLLTRENLHGREISASQYKLA